ncbi:acid-sensing ion channel 1-like [Stegodyphus dumicola]|uniref:acid-sensing ion channel 1-like n=1 Tax=Stegodyphus dumicola TaxID=202533 RepID=UPI0015ADEBFE|nr:acid-sensing ion channel 1-like [Stegodyphus dumicola]
MSICNSSLTKRDFNISIALLEFSEVNDRPPMEVSASSVQVIFVLCLLSVVSSIIFLVQECFGKESVYINSINKDSVIDFKDDPYYFPHYPLISICPSPPYRKDLNSSMLEIMEYASLALGFPFISLTPKENGHLALIARVRNRTLLPYISTEAAIFEEKLRNRKANYEKYKNSREDFNLKTFLKENTYQCNELFIDCTALVFNVNCCKVFERTLTPLGLCYEMVLEKQLSELMMKTKVDFPLTIDLRTTLHLGSRSVNEGYLVTFSDPREDPTGSQFLGVKMAVPNFLTSIRVKLIKTQRTALHTAWHGLSQSCPSMPQFDGMSESYGEHYTLATCDIHYLMYMYRKFCKCEAITYRGNSSRRLCEPEDIYSCVMGVLTKNNLTEMHEVCQKPCVEYKFTSEVSYMGLGGTNNSRLEIMYDSQQYVYEEYRTITFSSLFSQIGGSLGLYLGASIITSVELVSFALMYLWYRCLPTRRRKVHQEIIYPEGRIAYFK